MSIIPIIAIGIVGFMFINTSRAAGFSGNYKIPAKARPYMRLFRSAETKYSLPTNLLVRMAQQESYFNPQATNSSGEQGIMQIIPRWHPGIADPFNPSEAIPYAASYIKQMYDRFGRWDYAIMGYNMGPTAIARWSKSGANANKLPDVTKRYLRDVSKDVRLV